MTSIYVDERFARGIDRLLASSYARNRSAVMRRAVREACIRETGIDTGSAPERAPPQPAKRQEAVRYHERAHCGPGGAWPAGPIEQCHADVCVGAVRGKGARSRPRRAYRTYAPAPAPRPVTPEEVEAARRGPLGRLLIDEPSESET